MRRNIPLAPTDQPLPDGFKLCQRSVYFGTEKIDAVRCVLTIQRLANLYPWFSTCVRDVRMLRIEENNDLKPAIGI